MKYDKKLDGYSFHSFVLCPKQLLHCQFATSSSAAAADADAVPAETPNGGKRAKGCHKLHKFLISTADKMHPRDDTDDIAFDRWGQLQLLLLLHQQPKMAT